MADRGAHFVLVHGAWHGAWCWELVAPLLESLGHTVDAVDLPGRDDPETAAAATLDDFVGAVIDRVLAVPAPVMLVGHSLGGVTVSQAAERIPERIARLVFVSAFVPRDGENLADLAAIKEFQPSLAARYQELDPEHGVYRMPAEHARDVLFGTCPADIAEAAAHRLVPESLAVGGQPVSLTEGGLGRVRRVYIEALQDKAIPLDAQRAMCQVTGCDEVYVMDSDHSPFLSRPRELADLLHTRAIEAAGMATSA